MSYDLIADILYKKETVLRMLPRNYLTDPPTTPNEFFVALDQVTAALARYDICGCYAGPAVEYLYHHDFATNNNAPINVQHHAPINPPINPPTNAQHHTAPTGGSNNNGGVLPMVPTNTQNHAPGNDQHHTPGNTPTNTQHHASGSAQHRTVPIQSAPMVTGFVVRHDNNYDSATSNIAHE